jgi:hypothetical protein
VESSDPMSPEELHEKIRAAAVSFTDEVIALFGEAFASVASQYKAGVAIAKPGPSKPVPKKAAAPKKAPAPQKAPAPKKAAPSKPASKAKPVADKRNRRSANELSKVGDEVVKLLVANKKGMRVEEINKALGTTTRELMRPIQKLLTLGKIRKTGERRATTYFAG